MAYTKSRTWAVIFDMDGVIVDNMEYHKKAWGIFLEKYAPDIELEEFSKHFGKVNRDLLQIVFKREISGEEESRFGEEKEAIYREIYADHIVPTAGLLDILDSLKNNSIKTAVATAAPRINMDFMFEKTGIRKYFDVLIDATEVTRGKPDPEIYLKAAERLNRHPKDCLVFEDSFPGVQAARNAGMKVVALATSHPADRLQNADSVIKDFTEINFETICNYLMVVE
ncbi:MAG: HAD family phosphatase [Candidatus Aminicenantes bacterium]|jgi:beta-phosphoglucomutase family hydrolase